MLISQNFRVERKIFEEEGLENFIGEIIFQDNSQVIKFLEDKNSGVFQVITNSCKYLHEDGKDHLRLASKLKIFGQNPCYFAHKLKENIFGIKHTAKDVQYTTDLFVKKNSTELSKQLVQIISIGNPLIYQIFKGKLTDEEEIEEPDNNDPLKTFFTFKFTSKIKSLIDDVTGTQQSFIRCIKPNDSQIAGIWEPESVLKQMRYLLISSTVQNRMEFYPAREDFKKFYQRYQKLDLKSNFRDSPFSELENKTDLDWRMQVAFVVASLSKFRQNQVLVGKTRIFMSFELKRYLEARIA